MDINSTVTIDFDQIWSKLMKISRLGLTAIVSAVLLAVYTCTGLGSAVGVTPDLDGCSPRCSNHCPPTQPVLRLQNASAEIEDLNGRRGHLSRQLSIRVAERPRVLRNLLRRNGGEIWRRVSDNHRSNRIQRRHSAEDHSGVERGMDVHEYSGPRDRSQEHGKASL